MTDTDEVIAALNTAIELVEVWLADGEPAPTSDRVRLYWAVEELVGKDGRLAVARRVLVDSISGDLDDEPVEVDGVWVRRRFTRRRTGFDRDALRAEASRLALMPKGVEHRDPTPGEVLERVWKLADVATGRTKVWREVGVDLDEYAKEAEWVASIETVTP